MTTLSGPMFEKADDGMFKSVFGKEGGHYNNFYIHTGREMEVLRCFFPDGEANEMNFVLFSTSGVHGSYTTIEEVWPRKNPEADAAYARGEKPSDGDEWQADEVTFIIIQPRLCTVRHGNVKVTSDDDADFLRKLRQSSWDVVQEIGRHK